MFGELKKLTITPLKDASDKTGNPAEAFEAHYNPETITVSYSVEYAPDKTAGATGSALNFSAQNARSISFDLILDGTKVVLSLGPPPPTVEERIALFRTVTYDYSGDIHRPRFLKLSWGDINETVVLESYDLNYTLFSPDGKAMRAKISAKFKEWTTFEMMEAKKKNASPDLSHKHMVVRGDTLPNLCKKIYGDANLYQEVADYNGMANFRRLTVGMELLFPPLIRT